MSYEVWDISPWATAIDEMLNLEEKPEDEEEAAVHVARHWALTELYHRIWDHPFQDPDDTLADFCYEVAILANSPGCKLNGVNIFREAYSALRELQNGMLRPNEL